MVCVCVCEYYLAMRKKGILPFVTTWIVLHGIMLGAINQTDKDKHCMISLICGILKSCIHGNRVEQWLPKAGSREEWGVSV